ncbi:ABC transporter substrate-binding protein [uncultured Oceanicoccus sp.]|uniref:MlaC/ttg2D family ABC transporter substrate-binding protein n=1 Tax=uncultured Oceanicoccus sp. TaxID=1706381 RepID=UPI0030D719E5
MKAFQSAAALVADLFKLLFVATIVSVWAVTASAQNTTAPAQPSANEVVKATTDKVMKIIIEAQVYYDTDPNRFYNEIEQVLEDFVDFNSFARGVMGVYASKKQYMALETNKEKAAFKARMKRFANTFQDGLVQTYAKGLLAFNGNKIEVLPPAESTATEGSVTVTQHVYGDSEKPYVVQYKMRKNRSGEWKLRNLTIEAINLGRVYQSQFRAAARQYQGDIDAVIDNWTVDPTNNATDT